MRFTWDPAKERSNKRKHGIGFQEATTVFGDPLAVTVPDPDHSAGEERLLTIGQSTAGQLVVVCHSNKGLPFALFRLAEPQLMNEKTMKHKVKEPEMRTEYNFSGGVRGKYYKRYMESSNVVVLEPDVHKRFKNARAVNKALRSLMRSEGTQRGLKSALHGRAQRRRAPGNR